MKVFIPVILVFILVFVFFMVDIPTAKDLELQNDSNLYLGEGEVCSSLFAKAVCLEGYTCTRITGELESNISICVSDEKLREGNFTLSQYEADKVLNRENFHILDE